MNLHGASIGADLETHATKALSGFAAVEARLNDFKQLDARALAGIRVRL